MNAQIVLQVVAGAFFALSGYNKLTNEGRHKDLRATLVADKVPFVGFNEWWVPANEFVWGFALAVGLWPRVAAVPLLVICLVACVTDAPARVRAYKPINRADWVDDWLYLPEVAYAVILGVIVAG